MAFNYKQAIDNENLRFEKEKQKKMDTKKQIVNLAERKEKLVDLEVKPKTVLFQEKAISSLQDLITTLDSKNLSLNSVPTKSYVGVKIGRKVVFAVKWTTNGNLYFDATISDEQFKASGFKGKYLNRYAEMPLNGDIKDFAKIAQVAIDNVKAKTLIEVEAVEKCITEPKKKVKVKPIRKTI